MSIARSSSSRAWARGPACVLNPATPLAAIEHGAGRPRPRAGDERQSGLRRPGLHRKPARQDRRPAQGDRCAGQADRPRGRWRRQSGDGQALHRRPAPTRWWPAPRCSPAARASYAANIKALRSMKVVATGSQGRPHRGRPGNARGEGAGDGVGPPLRHAVDAQFQDLGAAALQCHRRGGPCLCRRRPRRRSLHHGKRRASSSMGMIDRPCQPAGQRR